MLCPICNKEGDEGDNDFIKITQLGANGVNNASRIRNDNIYVNDGDYVQKSVKRTMLIYQELEKTRHRHQWKKVDGSPKLPDKPMYVLDGGSLSLIYSTVRKIGEHFTPSQIEYDKILISCSIEK